MGHDYGPAQTERDRRERGSEVVVTVREFRECARCGHRRIISENKEVTTDATPEPPDEPAVDGPDESSWAPLGDDADGAVADSVGSFGDAGGLAGEPMTAEEDDGIILEDDADEPPPRGYGEWPEADSDGDEVAPEGEPEPWPDEAAASPDSEADEPPSQAAESATLDVGPEPTGADGPAAADPDGSAEVLDAGATPTDEPSTDPSPAQPEQPTPRPDPTDVELVCPDCGETWPSVNVSLRPGDICPDCRLGYLDEQVIQ